MWSSLGQSVLIGGAQSVAGSLGYTAATGVAIESLILINQHVFIPLMEKADIELTKKIFGVEAAEKTKQDWVSIHTNYLNPILGVVSITNKTLMGNASDTPNRPEEHAQGDNSVTTNPTLSRPNLVYTKEGIARDISKVGPAGSTAIFESDTGEQKMIPSAEEQTKKRWGEERMSFAPEFVAYKTKFERENPTPSEESKRMLSRIGIK